MKDGAFILLKMCPDTIFLQEIYLKDPSMPIFKPSWFPLPFQALGNSKTRGVTILLSRWIYFREHDIIADNAGRFLFMKGWLEDQTLTLGSFYAPITEQVIFYSYGSGYSF